MKMFFILSFFVLLLMYLYIGWRIIIPSNIRPFYKRMAWAGLCFFLLNPFVTFFLKIKGYVTIFTDILAWTGYISLGFVFLLFVLLIFRDILFILFYISKKIVSVIFSDSKNPGVFEHNRRQFLLNLTNTGTAGAAVFLAGYGIYETWRLPEVNEIPVPISGLPSALEGFRIVQISDIHVGSTIKREYVNAIVQRVNSLKPHILAFTGDIADGYVNSLAYHVLPLGDIVTVYGSFFVTGNHEYYSGAMEWIKVIKKLGFKVLMNEGLVLKKGSARLFVSGVPDYSAHRFIENHRANPSAALKGAPEESVKIFLAHQPRSVPETENLDIDLILCGHTHGGQIFPFNYFVSMVQPYLKGLYTAGKKWVYVNRGTGYWGPPMRVGSPSEITLIKLTNAHQVYG